MRPARFALPWIALLAGCGEQPVVDDPAKEDRTVLKIVAEDLVRHPDFRVRGAGSKLVVWETTEGLSGYITTGQLSSELSDQPPVSMELYNNLKFRNGRKMTLDAIDSTIVVMANPDRVPKERFGFESAFEKAFPDAKAYVGFWLPAYSEDGRTALVRFGFGPTPHGACGTYVLEKSGGAWKILWRKLSFYA